MARKGPIGAFVPHDDGKAREMVQQGLYLPPGIFQNVEIFNEVEQKRLRYDTKRLKELHEIIKTSDAEEFQGADPIETQLEGLFLQQATDEAVLVEACRKWKLEEEAGTLLERHRWLYADCIEGAQQALYPTFDPDIAQSSINKILKKFQGSEEMPGLTERYPFLVSREVASLPTLNPEIKDAWRDMLHERYDPAVASVQAEFEKSGIELSNTTLPQAAKLFMGYLGMPLRATGTAYDKENNNGWDTVEDLNRSGWVNDPATKNGYSGKRSTEITWESFGGLMVHEVGIHDIRAEQGSKTGYEAFQIGLPGSGEAEEGWGLILQQLWANKNPDLLGRDDFRYLGVAYAEGSLDGVGHTEQETYQFVDDILRASGLAKYDAKGMNAGALDHTRRAFRGMPEGTILRSNYAYRAGKIAAIRQMSVSGVGPEQLYFIATREI